LGEHENEFSGTTSYRNHSFYTMRTDSWGCSATAFEKPLMRKAIYALLVAIWLDHVRFSECAPYCFAVGSKQ
jgi:hypothetical protein